MSTQNVNVARFARNVEWDFFCDFQTPCFCSNNNNRNENMNSGRRFRPTEGNYNPQISLNDWCIRTHRCAVAASLFLLLVLDYLLDAVQKLDAGAVDISAFFPVPPTFLSAYNFYQKRPSKKSEVTTMLKSASGNLITWMQQMMSIRECKKILIKEAINYILDFIPSK